MHGCPSPRTGAHGCAAAINRLDCSLTPRSGEVLFAVVPFGELVELRDAQGRELPGADSVPLPALLRLPPGEWTARVRYPVSGEVASLALSIAAGESLRLDHRFTRLEARAYFEVTGW